MKDDNKSDKKMPLTDKEKKMLIKAQQGEMDAVLVYNNLARVVKNKAVKDQLKLMAAEEGKHASILKTYTGEVLKPKAGKSMMVLLLYRIIGFKQLAKIMSKNEYKAATNYESLVEKFKKVKELISDEKKHGALILKLSEEA